MLGFATTAFVAFSCISSALSSKFTFKQELQNPTVENAYMRVGFDTKTAMITEISADFLGEGNYGPNLLVVPFELVVDLPGSSSKKIVKKAEAPRFTSEEGGIHTLRSKTTTYVDATAAVSEDWEVIFNENSRSFKVKIYGEVTSSMTVNSLHYAAFVNNPSIHGMFGHGAFQMMNKDAHCMGTDRPIRRAYFLGGGSSLDIEFYDRSVSAQHVFTSTTSDDVAYKAGVQHIVAGNYPNMNGEIDFAWSGMCWQNTEPVQVSPGNNNWTVSFTFTGNNYDFPAYLLADLTETKKNINFNDLRATMTGIYASPEGCLQSYYNKHDGIIAPTVAAPKVGYAPLSNFFDPDSFISLSALLYSNDNYLLYEVKKVLLRTGDTMCGLGSYEDPIFCLLQQTPTDEKNKNNNQLEGSDEFERRPHAGQIMHHFDTLRPEYSSIAGSTQLGPNIFWTLTCLRYIAATQDDAFASQALPFIKKSTDFLLRAYDQTIHLIKAPGPLWIDVFVRENYASDSNAMMVYYLHKVADFYDYMGYNKATNLREIAGNMTIAINTHLWSATEDDHFITQMNPDKTTRDFVDFDSNLIALAFGIVTDASKAAKILKRIDSNPYAHARATWVSEKPYTGSKTDCYSDPVANGLCGDSNMTMARIGWVDALARKRYGDKATFENLILKPLQEDLIKNTWLTERYDQNGSPIRTNYYFEYASLVPILLREVAYGINVDLLTVTIDPMSYSEFDYNMGYVKISYHPKDISIELGSELTRTIPNVRAKQTTLHSLLPNTNYQVASTCWGDLNLATITSDANGVLTFPMKYATDCKATVKAV